MNDLTENELNMVLSLINSEAIERKHIEGTPTEWVVIHDKLRDSKKASVKKQVSSDVEPQVFDGAITDISIIGEE